MQAFTGAADAGPTCELITTAFGSLVGGRRFDDGYLLVGQAKEPVDDVIELALYRDDFALENRPAVIGLGDRQLRA